MFEDEKPVNSVINVKISHHKIINEKRKQGKAEKGMVGKKMFDKAD